jgi:hypothetical protein
MDKAKVMAGRMDEHLTLLEAEYEEVRRELDKHKGGSQHRILQRLEIMQMKQLSSSVLLGRMMADLGRILTGTSPPNMKEDPGAGPSVAPPPYDPKFPYARGF